MAALSPTVGDVRPIGNTNSTSVVQAGVALTQLQTVYLDTGTGKYLRGVTTSDTTVGIAGVAITKADADEDYFIMMTAGIVDPGTTVVVGQEYCVGTSDGDIVPRSDLVNPNRYTRVGYGTEANRLVIDIAIAVDSAGASVVIPV